MVTKVANLRPDPRQIDPDVKVPEAVRRAAEAATAAQLAAYPDQATTPTPEVVAAPNSDGITIADPSATVTPPGNSATPAATPAPPAPPAPVDPNDQTWEHKFNSERGRHARTQTMLSQATDRLSSLENIVHDMQAARTTAAPAPTPAAPARLVSEQEENEFGTEMLDVMGRRAREIVSPELAEMRAIVQGLEAKLNGTTQVISRDARANMLSSLDSKMPEWRNVNNLAEFKAWLALPDPYFGVTRHSALLSAFEQNDTPRVLNFFKGFVSELAATTPASGLPVPLDPAAVQPVKLGLETLAAPGRARTPAQTDVPAEKQIITTADINAFYAAKARGAYTGREAEFLALEQELFKAQREGRVRAV